MRLASWNVRTMCPGLSDDLCQIADSRNKRQLSPTARQRSSTWTLQYYRRPDSPETAVLENRITRSSCRERNQRNTVCIALDLQCAILYYPLLFSIQRKARFLRSLRLSTSSGTVNNISVQAPTLCCTSEEKNEFYDELETTIREFPATEQLFMPEGFNARVGTDFNS